MKMETRLRKATEGATSARSERDRLIREAHGKMSLRQIAAATGLSKSRIGKIVAGALVALALVPAAAAASQPDRAMARYESFWQKVAPFYGADGQPAPRVVVGGAATSVGLSANGTRQVNLPVFMTQALGGKSKSKRRWVERNLIHEWAHVYQSDATWLAGIQFREEHAMTFTDLVAAHLDRPRQIRRAKKAENRKRLRRLRRTLPAPDVSAFGSYYGANPQTIPWPYQ